MAINYSLDAKLNILGEFLEEYQRWHTAVVKSLLLNGPKPDAPKKMIDWLNDLSLKNIDLDGRYASKAELLRQKHQVLVAMSGVVNQDADKQLDTFLSEYVIFMNEMQSFCQAVLLEQWGLDVLTGLKNKAVLHRELAVEMERLSREGYPFCLGLARIDHFDDISKAVDAEKAESVIKGVSDLVLKSLRSYDEAFRVSRNHFIMCLKQSDLVGGQKGLERLRDLMEAAEITVNLNGEDKLVSLSCCVAAPLPGDDVDDLIDNLYVDLDKQIKDDGSVLAYQEMSPLERFMKTDGKE
jgi:diguanylate cyclase (GGDEF)-like protein